ncbi:MAG: sigma-70 family RNA polymerase sigma factor [Gammaproteobacteria bacterium]|nr:sigma-70 family RNA polymerase sigma factor [Gammaproteobacteria bacterium]MDH5276359.1 sigma-70 family RNA polymerase sigma factor [Gammaproteobacteria bacterium]
MLALMVEAADDALLMTRYGIGDVPSFAPLYARHKGPLYRYFVRQCGNAETADELFQDVWLRLIKARERFEPRVPFTVYLYRIAHNCLVEHFRKSGRALTSASDTGQFRVEEIREAVAEEIDPAFASGRWSLVEWDGDPARGPGAALTGAERTERLRMALETLPMEQRETFLLREEAGMGLAEIAAVTGANAEAVKSRLLNALKTLRAAVGDLAPADSR